MSEPKYVQGCSVPFDIEAMVTGLRLVVEKTQVTYGSRHTQFSGFGDAQCAVVVIRSGDPEFDVEHLGKFLSSAIDIYLNKRHEGKVSIVNMALSKSLSKEIRAALKPKRPSEN